MNTAIKPDDDFRIADAKAIFLRWERLRVGYNLILLLVTLGCLFARWPEARAPWYGWFVICLIGAVMANLCFFAAPATETYLHWLGVRSRAVTTALFLLGVLVSIPLVFATLDAPPLVLMGM